MQAGPIIPWLGGKRRLAEKLFPLFPKHSCYVELFCGGAALYFLRPVAADVEVLNDVNGELINLYRVVEHHLGEFVDHFRWSLTSRAKFGWLQDTAPRTLTDIQRAARFFYLQHHAFGGKVAGQSFGTATTASGIVFTRIEENLSAAHMRMASSGTCLENLHWAQCMKIYDRPHTFFYADPPYWKVEGYGVPFEWSEYEALAEQMAQSKGKVMLSINDHPDIRALFARFNKLELDIKYSVANNHGSPSTARELVITNYDVEDSGLFGTERDASRNGVHVEHI